MDTVQRWYWLIRWPNGDKYDLWMRGDVPRGSSKVVITDITGGTCIGSVIGFTKDKAEGEKMLRLAQQKNTSSEP